MATTTAPESRDAMIAVRVKAGYNAQQSRELLADLLRLHGPTTLAAALAYHGFTER